MKECDAVKCMIGIDHLMECDAVNLIPCHVADCDAVMCILGHMTEYDAFNCYWVTSQCY